MNTQAAANKALQPTPKSGAAEFNVMCKGE